LSIKHAILGLLVDGPLHGYKLKSAYEEELVPGAEINIGQIYQALNRLEADGFVTVEVQPQSERPDRKVYTLTPKGRAELDAWLRAPSERGLELRNESFLKLMLADRLRRRAAGPRVGPLEVLAAERRVCLESLRELTDLRVRAQQDSAAPAALLLLELGIARLNAFHQWLERCEETLRAAEDMPT
jgi:DNA-binding PadR family transcriptional regulator